MTSTVIVRYSTRPEAAEENSRLIAEVFAALAELEPSDFSYTSYLLPDGVSFVHVAHTGESGNPLPGLPAFKEFQRELAQRVVEQPVVSGASVVGSYKPVALPAG